MNRLVEQNVLLLTFAALMLIAAAGMLIQPPEAGTDTAEGRRVSQSDRSRKPRLLPLRLGAAGLLIGALTGFSASAAAS